MDTQRERGRENFKFDNLGGDGDIEKDAYGTHGRTENEVLNARPSEAISDNAWSCWDVERIDVSLEPRFIP